MTFTLRESSSAVAAPARVSVPAADPWDAPYFGGRVYFSYHPTLYATLHIPPAPALPLAAIASSAPAISAAPALLEPELAQSLSHSPVRLGLDPWDAPYFGGPVYFNYPAFPVAVAALASPAAQLDPKPAAPSGSPKPAPDSPVSPARSAPPVALETSVPPAATPATPATPAAMPAPTPPRRGWLARLFRAG